DVEVVGPAGEVAPGPQAERERLGERGRAQHEELEGVDVAADVEERGLPQRVVGPVEVEARQPDEPDGLVDLRIGRPRDDLDVVAEGGQLAAEVAGVDALAPAVGAAAVDQEGDAESCVGSGHEGKPSPAPDRPVKSTVPCATS